MDVNNLGYINFLEFGYGFYYMAISIVLLFIAYFMQFFIDFSKTSDDDKEKVFMIDLRKKN